MTLVLSTYDWVPEMPRGHVRDIRIRWLLEELSRPYIIETVPLRDKTADHLAQQPFHQVPLIRDGDLILFESGAILLYLADGTVLMPEAQRPLIQQWLIAGLNSIETFSISWLIAKFFEKDDAGAARCEPLLRQRLSQLQAALNGRDWLVGDHFTVADLLMADILRIPARNGLLDDLPELAAYAQRATARPAFLKALSDQMAHFRTADSQKPAGANH